jgi:hypothetical protein
MSHFNGNNIDVSEENSRIVDLKDLENYLLNYV